jgi:hypothetical protein
VEICLDDLEQNTLGIYKTIENKEHKYKFKHKIIINRFVFDEFERGYKPDIFGEGKYKTYCKKRIKGTIAHELIHAYAYEKYEFCNDYRFHADGSPLFLSIVTFLDIPCGHITMKGFKHTQMYEKVKNYDSFELLEIYLITLACKYKKTFKQLEEMVDGNSFYINKFAFSLGNVTGIRGLYTNTTVSDKFTTKGNLFELGANTNIEILKDLVLSKIRRNIFEQKHVMLKCENILDKKNKLRLQSMDV